MRVHGSQAHRKMDVTREQMDRNTYMFTYINKNVSNIIYIHIEQILNAFVGFIW